MKAIAYTKYGSTEVLDLKDIRTPTPGDNEVLIRILATTVTPVDVAFRKGSPYFARLFTGLTKPKNQILGTELAGIVQSVGKDVTRFSAGDEVFASPASGAGAHAEYICLPENGAITLKPANLTFEEAAAICNGALTALPFLRDSGKIQPGQRVLINGASGSIGIFAVQLAKHFGAHVTGVSSTSNLEFVESLGADDVVDHTQEDFAQRCGAFDIVFDTVGKSSFALCKDALTPNGKYLSTVLSPSILRQMLWTSAFGGKKAAFAATGLRSASDQSKDLAYLKPLLENGTLKTVIDRIYPLDQIAEAYRYVESGHKRGNVVVTVQQDKAAAQSAA